MTKFTYLLVWRTRGRDTGGVGIGRRIGILSPCAPMPYARPMTMAIILRSEMKTESAAMLAANEDQWRQTA